MTIYEHAMFGINGALAAGLQRRGGWQIVALAGLASLLPDADGLTLLLGPRCYFVGHRIWTHNLLVTGIAAAILAAVAYESDFFSRIQKWLARFFIEFLPVTQSILEGKGNGSNLPERTEECHTQRGTVPFSRLWLWLAVGVIAAYCHLLIDVFYSGGRGLPVWGVPLFWPFSDTRYAYPLVTWGDVGATVIFITSMFAMLRWKVYTRSIAAGSLLAVTIYVILRGVVG